MTVRVVDPQPPPGPVVAVLDHLERRSLRTTWMLAPDAAPALLDRLYITGHEVAVRPASTTEVAGSAAAVRSMEIPVASARLDVPRAPCRQPGRGGPRIGTVLRHGRP